jgi:hypothetical protein
LAPLLLKEYCDGFAQSIARQRLDKHPATYVQAANEVHASLGNGEVNTPGILENCVFDAVCAIAT